MDEKFYLVNENLRCPKCKSDKVYLICESKYSGAIVKCKNCGTVMLESDLDEKEEEENEKTRNKI